MGFLGIGGGQRKKEAEKTQAAARGLREDIGRFRTGMETYRTAPRPDVDLLRSQYRGMVEDPSRRGFSPETVSAMYARSAEPLVGARQSMANKLRQAYNAQGMGATGGYQRALMETQPAYEGQLRGAQRDIDLRNEELKRSELWQALQGVAGTQEMEDAFNRAMYGLEAGTYGEELGTFGPELEAQKQAYKSVWGPFLQNLLGQAVGGFGYGLGNRAGGGKPVARGAGGGV